MERTLGTINTAAGVARLVHDDKEQSLIARYTDRPDERFDDFQPTQSWRNARKQILAWYQSLGEHHDIWVLCVRPTRALQGMQSEQAPGHKHLCLRCNTVIAEGVFDCEIDRDHDFALCDSCVAKQ